MSFLAGLCGCFTRSSPQSSTREMEEAHGQSRNHGGIQTGHFTLSGHGDFIRLAPSNGHGPPPADSEDGGYASVVPLPQYTPRPVSIHEKTLGAHLRDPPQSSEGTAFAQDEKDRNLCEEDVTSDGSSAISFPSSYGNTSTATRETPPPPYSPRQSVMLSRSRSISISSAMAVTINPPPMARLNNARLSTAPPSEADDQSIRRHRRVSWESR
ncbi:hypothetical protein N7492_009210 [Penicillium capsulatum]|uniref:Uncharacterized protein n=1 Tax=Penicillium capsulatum TaxID=69766 RepID=A0A9W9HSI0_9EURO|nr:hypothetical protein N7492_009210 [Penicillium capsulatum]KAJ6106606.1 hypothetical protein N7512_010123 [Penicillium capsulatum]